MAGPKTPLKLTQVGHPFNPIGTGRATRLVFAAARAVGIDVSVRDVYKFQQPETAQARAIAPHLTDSFGPVNIFHLNGDEIEPALKHLGGLPPAHNIIAPFWELPRFPNEWARQVQQFDEVWAPSAFIQNALAAAVTIPVRHMPMATEITLERFLGRRHFGIPENSFAFFTFFDGRSYMARKNPQAVVDCFRRVIAARPFARTCLVIKLHGGDTAPKEVKSFLDRLADLGPRSIIINASLPEAEIHNLIRACDAFISLHRSEGFGLGLAEAMYLEKPVIGTGWSGNMDFMTPQNSHPIPYSLIPVPENAYPHAENQEWADPDLNAATDAMLTLLDNPESGRTLGTHASRDMRTKFSLRARGLAYATRLSEIMTHGEIAA
jgi:glycosyltransferase involved in cell wall biosynthesis